MKEQAQLPFGGRRGTRPATVTTCPSCNAVLGTHYPQCSVCCNAIERIWQADWQALLTHEQIEQGSADETLLAQVVIAEWEQHPWTIVDFAMTHVHCATCGSQLGGGPNDCGECAMAFGNLWWYDIAASQQGNMTGKNMHYVWVGGCCAIHTGIVCMPSPPGGSACHACKLDGCLQISKHSTLER